MVNDFPVVSVWTRDNSEYRMVGQILTYRTLSFEKRYLEPGPWQLELDYDESALSIVPNRLVSIDWRGQILTGCIEQFNPSVDTETGQPILTVGGTSALSLLGRELAWYDATKVITQQPYPTPRIDGNAETVIRTLVGQNYVTRRGGLLDLGTNGNRGGDVKARPAMTNLLELVAKKAKRGGIGVDVTLERTSPMRAKLVLKVWEPADKTGRVRLSQSAGTLRDWQQDSAAPTATEVIVGGAGTEGDRVFRVVSTSKSQTSANDWGGKRVVFVDGPESFDNPELDEAGQEALDDGAETLSLTFTAAEAEGLQAFRDYDVGDKATGELLSGVEVQDVITSIGVTAGDEGVDVVPGFGDPDRKDPALQLSQEIKTIRRNVRGLQTRR